MSLDDTFVQMGHFARELELFNQHLKVSMQDLQTNHDRVSPLWQDAMRREHDAQWREFDEMIKNYLARESKEYEEFLASKLRSLHGYLREN